MSPPVRKVNLTEMFGRFQDQWSPKIVGEVNDNLVKLTKLEGEFVWRTITSARMSCSWS